MKNILDDPPPKSHLKWIEFMGPSGVGKSTLFNKLGKQRDDASLWVTPNEALEEIAKRYMSKNNWNISFSIRVKQAMKMFSPLHHSSTYPLVSDLLRTEATHAIGHKYNLLAELMIQYYSKNIDLEPWKIIGLISWYFRDRIQDFMVMDYYCSNKVVVHGDGILHNNDGISDIKESETDKAKLTFSEHTLVPLGIIYCINEKSVILEWIKTRNIREGTIIQKNMTDTELKDCIDKDFEINRKKIQFYQSMKVPIINIYTSDDLNNNTKKINTFIKTVL